MYVGENAGHKPDLILVQRKDQCLPSATAEQSILQNLILQVCFASTIKFLCDLLKPNFGCWG